MALPRLNLAPRGKHKIVQRLLLSIVIWLAITAITSTSCLLLRNKLSAPLKSAHLSTNTNKIAKACNTALLQRKISQIKLRITRWRHRTTQHNQVAGALQLLSTKLPSNAQLTAISANACSWHLQATSTSLADSNQIMTVLNKTMPLGFSLINVHELKDNRYQFTINSNKPCNDS